MVFFSFHLACFFFTVVLVFCVSVFEQYKDAFMKANPGYKWCPATSKPVKSPTHAVTSNVRKKTWSVPSNNTKDISVAKKVPKTGNTPQLNFAMAGGLHKIQICFGLFS